MILGIMIPEEKLHKMTDAEKLQMLNDAYARSKTAKYNAINYAERLRLLRCPVDRMYEVLDEKQSNMVRMLLAGLFE